MNKRLLVSLVIALLIAIGTFVAIKFANGYRPDVKTGTWRETGMLVADSTPKGAQVFIDGKLTTATDDTLNLPPRDYEVEIKKDGYSSWKKNLKIETSLASQTSALLFPAVPDLTPLTFAGVQNPTHSPDGQKIAFVVTQATSAEKNGLYILDLTDRPLNMRSEARQIARNLANFSFDEVQLTWSPDASQIVASQNGSNIILDATSFNQPADIKDVTAQLPVILLDWQENLDKKQIEMLNNLPDLMINIATSSAKNLYWSPNGEKLLYTATASAIIDQKLISPLPASNSQPEKRILEPGEIYVYDLKEDKNFLIGTAPAINQAEDEKTIQSDLSQQLTRLAEQYSPLRTQSLQWFPSSRHLIKIYEDRLTILEYDGTNEITIYRGPFEEGFTYPWPNGSKLIILTALGQESALPNLYAIGLN